ncbi:MAG: bifunctional DedA family/phosphatase PAP2 family protein [Rhizobiales bacterium]|nr:bifunctional DedA family/phosphatase PAP2 family protein [Hyphomicrobiales bacterium]
METIQPYLDYFAQNPSWAIAIVFLIAFGEALLIIGLFVPSTAVLVGAGMLVGTGHLDFWPILLATVIGAILGDQLSYWAGRLFGERLKTMWPLNRYPALVARGEDFVRQHGGKSIAIGRFVPGVKAVVPGIVGMFGMGQLYFAAVNISSGIVWGAAHILPGMLLGQGLALAGELSGRLVVVLLVLLVILAIAGWLIRLGVAGVSPLIGRGLGRISAWSRRRSSPFWRRFGRTIAPENPRSLLVVIFAAVAVTALIALVDMTIGIFASEAFLNTDISVNKLMRELRNAPADDLMVAITMLGDWPVMTALGLAMAGWLFLRRSWRAGLAVLAAIISARIFVFALKYGIQKARPIELYPDAAAYAFPSGHTAIATVTLGVLAVLVSHSMGRWGRSVVFAICGIAIVAIAYSRLYLGVHWLSDVLGGFLFGAIVTAAFGVVLETIPPRRIAPAGLAAMALAAIVVAGAAHIGAGFAHAVELYAPRHIVHRQSITDWQTTGWKKLPYRRIDLAGRPEEVFAVQWLGGPAALAAVLDENGWKLQPKWHWKDGLPYLNPQATLDELAPRPILHEGLRSLLTWTKSSDESGDNRLVLRLWRSDYEVVERGGSEPIYLLSLTRERLRRGMHLYAVPSPVPPTEEDMKAFLSVMERTPAIRIIAGTEATDRTVPVLVTAAQ